MKKFEFLLDWYNGEAVKESEGTDIKQSPLEKLYSCPMHQLRYQATRRDFTQQKINELMSSKVTIYNQKNLISVS